MRGWNHWKTFFIVCILPATACFAVIMTSQEGGWPQSWPKELEVLRKQSQTVEVAHGIQEKVYVIPFDSQKQFEKVWPKILEVKSKGAPLRLEKSPFIYGVSGTRTGTGVMILATSEGFVSGSVSEADTPPTSEKLKQMLIEKTCLRASEPWPNSIMNERGELPEYVTAKSNPDGTMYWVVSSPGENKDDDVPGFYHRSRVDIILITDGKTVDLNHIKIPADTPIIDNRF